jgi:hypothetical protein
MTGLWILVVVVGTLTFLGNDMYDTEEDCNQYKQIVTPDVKSAVCAPLDAMIQPDNEIPPADNDG